MGYFDIIYIDPPYNTENINLSYQDNRNINEWIKFIKCRLELSYKYLSENGVIFISIDDKCLYHLKIICDSIYGEDNFLGTFITKQAQRSNSKYINTIHEYILVYAKNIKKLEPFRIKRINNPNDREMIEDLVFTVLSTFKKEGRNKAEKKLKELIYFYMEKRDITWLKNYSEIDNRGRIFFPKDLSVPGEPNELFIEELNLRLKPLSTRKWSTKEKILKLHKQNLLHYKHGRPYEMHYLESSYDNIPSILDFYSRQGTNNLVKLGLRDLFDTPKPVELIKYLIRLSMDNIKNGNILDFFAGSGTTAQAIYEINIEDGKDYKYCLMQLDEKIDEKSISYKFCKDNNIEPYIDQILIKRIDTVIKKYNIKNKYKILKQ